MKEISDKKVYQCEYCNKLSLNKGAMAVHEMCCKKNPKNWTPCASCIFLKKETYEVEGSEGERCKHCPHFWSWGCRGEIKERCHLDAECEGKTIITEFVCEKTGKKMYYPRKVLMMRKDKRDEIIKRCDCAMPNECDMMESEW